MSDARAEGQDIAALLASVGWGETPSLASGLLVIVLDPPRVIWANGAAITLFNTARRDKLSRLVLGNSAVQRSMGARLERLKAGAPPHLERILLATGFRVAPLTLLCKAVDPALAPATVVAQVVGTAMPRPIPTIEALPASIDTADEAPEMIDQPAPARDAGLPRERPAEPASPENPSERDAAILGEHESETAEGPAIPTVEAAAIAEPPRMSPETLAAHFHATFGAATVQRFVWQADASGRLTDIGPTFAACVGAAALQPGALLVDGIASLSSEAADAIGRTMQERQSWTGVVVPWPVENADALVAVSLGGAPRIGGYRGFGIVHLGQITRVPPRDEGPAASDDEIPDAPMRDEAAPGAATDDAVAAHAASDEAVAEHIHPDKADVDDAALAPLSEDREAASQADDTIDVPVAAEPPVADEMPTPPQTEGERWGRLGRAGGPRQDGDLGTSKVVHLSSFKPAAPAGPSPTLRSKPTTPEVAEVAADLDAPRWAETPEPAERDETEAQLSSNERYNFDEIARTLGAGPPAFAAKAPDLQDGPSGPARELAAESKPAADVASLLDYLPIGTIVTQSGRLVYANRTILDLLGYETLDAMHTAGGLDRLFQGQAASLMLETIATQPVTIASRDGDAVAADVRLQTIRWQGEPATLLSVRRSLDREVGAQMDAIRMDLANSRLSVGDLTEALDLAVSGMGVLDAAGRILSINAGAERLFAYDQREIVGDACAVLLGADQKAAWTSFFDGFVSDKASGRTTAFRRFGGRKRTGEMLRLTASLRRVGPDRICILWNDESHRHGTESEIDAARREAERSSSLKSEFLAKVSHEIRTPLNAILGFTEIIMDERFGSIGNERYKEYLKDIHASGTHVMSLVNDLLDLSRIEAGGLDLNLVPVNPNAIVSESVATLQGQAHRERIIIRSSLASRLPAALADERALRQIVLNLLSNAVKFNEPGGQVIVSTTVTESGAVAIRVRDTGLGMSDEEIAIAMKPFRQLATPKASAGSGLGLPLTKALVDANRASMTIKSRPREGTLVEVILQRAPTESVSLPAE